MDGPLAPGILTLLAARVRETPLEAMATLIGALAMSAGIIWLNARAANRIQRELDAL
ncbi:MAG: hypothetical protein AB7P99_05880 [Vicinamibacterales bacterium]